jgi:hypothetical protein
MPFHEADETRHHRVLRHDVLTVLRQPITQHGDIAVAPHAFVVADDGVNNALRIAKELRRFTVVFGSIVGNTWLGANQAR